MKILDRGVRASERNTDASQQSTHNNEVQTALRAAYPAAGESDKTNDKPIPPGLKDFDRLPDSANVRLPVVCALLGISAPTVYRWVREGRIPAPRKIGPRVSGWRVSDLRALLA